MRTGRYTKHGTRQEGKEKADNNYQITNIKNSLSNPARAHKVATDFINKCLLEALSSSAHVRAE